MQAARKAGLDPGKDFKTENQQPQVGATALESGSVAALSQFVAWPGLLVHQGRARLLYDGGALGVPTFHGVVVRERYAAERSDVVEAFLRAQLDATTFLHRSPLQAAQVVADVTGLPAEVVYLYNGPGGVATFDPTVKPVLREALARDVPFLKEIGVLQQVDLATFVDDTQLRAVYGANYDQDAGSTVNPAPISGNDPVCDRPVNDPALASELWLADSDLTQPAATPTCLLRAVQAAGTSPRAAYVPDTSTGTRWFADKSVWVRDPAAPEQERFKPFSTETAAQSYLDAHAGSRRLSYAEAVAGAA